MLKLRSSENVERKLALQHQDISGLTPTPARFELEEQRTDVGIAITIAWRKLKDPRIAVVSRLVNFSSTAESLDAHWGLTNCPLSKQTRIPIPFAIF